ncbi:clostripain-related cysteine peptidase [Treponema sp.]|uniref:clostripain-related cysteine peptidase n=1 Tax=Treponema sp. TaxID=166 RepID=UPI00298D6B8D|nr:clostripain-related cysteine peptidase [Treponema sp.]MCQ2240598.1 clostripain-related cysteine peptidase [Treponema sp.]
MKKVLFVPLLFCGLFFFSCVQTVETVVKQLTVNTFEDSGTKVTESEYFKNGKKTSDWLLIMYMDADDIKLESSIRNDFNEVEYGLSLIRNADGSAKTGFDSVRVVVLWDGLQVNDSRVFELGADELNPLPGSNTVNISNVTNYFTELNSKEVNMSNKDTLTHFISWVDAHYTSEKGKILHVADHGSGPGNFTRAMCLDSSSGTAWMSSSEFSNALFNAGYGYMKNKFSALLLDVCLGASIEDAYEFRNSAEYMIASPNSTPGPGFYYVDVMQCFKSGLSVQELSVEIGKTFAVNYRNTYTGTTVPTISVIDLSKVSDCAVEIDSLASMLKNKVIKDKNNKSYYIYPQFLKPISSNVYYEGSVNYLYDLGYFAFKVQNYDLDDLKELDYPDVISVRESLEDIKEQAAAVSESLEKAIVYSWRKGIFSYGLTSPNTSFGYNDEDKSGCGITICGGFSNDTKGIPSWYKTDLQFGAKSDELNGCWAELMETWFK